MDNTERNDSTGSERTSAGRKRLPWWVKAIVIPLLILGVLFSGWLAWLFS